MEKERKKVRVETERDIESERKKKWQGKGNKQIRGGVSYLMIGMSSHFFQIHI